MVATTNLTGMRSKERLPGGNGMYLIKTPEEARGRGSVLRFYSDVAGISTLNGSANGTSTHKVFNMC